MISDQQQLFLFIGAVAFAINLWVLFEIIKSATKSKRYIQLMESQIQLLTSIALKPGVSKDDIVKDTAGL